VFALVTAAEAEGFEPPVLPHARIQSYADQENIITRWWVEVDRGAPGWQALALALSVAVVFDRMPSIRSNPPNRTYAVISQT
jgi:hypothetical protein